jgi:Spy/CpxP family protein refolding chaperone
VSAGHHLEKRRVFREKKMKQTMKKNILTLVAAGAIALGGFVVVQAEPGPGGPGGWHGHACGLRHLTEQLNLTSDQQTKVQPILDAAKPQLVAIHQEAMQKAKGIIDSSLSQIRPLLTADQQKKLDAIQKAHQDMMNAHKELNDAMQE